MENLEFPLNLRSSNFGFLHFVLDLSPGGRESFFPWPRHGRGTPRDCQGGLSVWGLTDDGHLEITWGADVVESNDLTSGKLMMRVMMLS